MAFKIAQSLGHRTGNAKVIDESHTVRNAQFFKLAAGVCALTGDSQGGRLCREEKQEKWELSSWSIYVQRTKESST